MPEKPDPKHRRVARRKENDSAKGPTPDEVIEELEKVAMAPATSGRGAIAKVSALRELERRRRPGKRIPPPCPENWHPGPPWLEALDYWHFKEHPEARERWFRNLWKAGKIDDEGRLIE